jgi:DNA-binding transcriptional ArsR family regulator
MKPKVKTWLRNVENGKIRNFTEKILAKIKEESPDKDGYYQGLFHGSHATGISTYELRERTGISHQSLTAILSNLTDEGLIKATGEQKIADSTYSIYMFIHDLDYRKRLIAKRKEEKYVLWLKKADDYFEFMGHQTVKMICYEQQEHNVQ